jgi:uncharacterized delta-60 repeat protein
MKRLHSSITIILILFSFISVAQNVQPTWKAFHQGNGDNSDRFNKIVSDGTGNFVCVGYTIKDQNYRDMLTVKVNSSGDTLWWRTKNGSASADDEAIDVGVDNAGNVYVTGYVDGNNTQNNIALIKYDAFGVVQWDTTWDSPASLDDDPMDLEIDANGNVFIGGIAEPDTFTGSNDYITLKFATDGGVLWSQQYSGGFSHGKDELAAIALDAAGDVYVTGRSFNGTTDDYATIKYNGATGAQMWIQTYNGGNDDEATAIDIDNAGNVIITGKSDNGSNDDFRTIKYNNGGLLQWTRLYNAPANQDDQPTRIAIDASDNVIVAGSSDIDGSPAINDDFQTVKYNSAGTLQWAVRTGNTVNEDDIPNDVVVDASGNVFVTGKTDQSTNTTFVDNDWMTIMLNPSGGLGWSSTISYHAGTRPLDDDIASSLIIDGAFLYVVGGAVNNVTGKDATIVKYDIATGLEILVKDHNGEGDYRESAKAIVVDVNDNSYAAGYSFNEGQNLDAFLAKFDNAGTFLCSYTYNDTIRNDDDEFEAIAIASNGSIYAAGYTKVLDKKSNMLLVKFDPATCSPVWVWTYDSIGQADRAESIVLDAFGNIYLTGRSDVNPVDSSDNTDIVTFKFNSSGVVQWSKRFDRVGLRDEPIKIILDNNGDVLVAGRSENVHDDDYIAIKYNPVNGDYIWPNPIYYNGPFSNDDRATDIIVDASNNIFLGGFSQTMSGDAPHDPAIIKYDPNGNQLGFAPYIGEGKDEPVKMAVDATGNVYVIFKFDADVSGSITVNQYDYLLKKYNNALDTIFWTTTYNSPINGDDNPADIKISPNTGYIYVTGMSEHDSSGGKMNANWLTIGYDASGAQVFISNIDGPNATDDVANALDIGGFTMWVAGYTEGTGTHSRDFTVYNYNLITDINESNQYNSANVYPNPFNNECVITINDLKSNSQSYLEIYDMLGKAVTLPQAFEGNSVHVQRGNLAQGIYEYRVRTNSSTLAIGKLIIN